MRGLGSSKRVLGLTSFLAGGLIVASLASAALQPPRQASAQAESLQGEALRLDGLPEVEDLKDRQERDKDEYEREKEWRKEQAERDRERRKARAERERERDKRDAESARERDKWDAEQEREWDKEQAEREKERFKRQKERDKQRAERDRERRKYSQEVGGLDHDTSAGLEQRTLNEAFPELEEWDRLRAEER